MKSKSTTRFWQRPVRSLSLGSISLIQNSIWNDREGHCFKTNFDVRRGRQHLDLVSSGLVMLKTLPHQVYIFISLSLSLSNLKKRKNRESNGFCWCSANDLWVVCKLWTIFFSSFRLPTFLFSCAEGAVHELCRAWGAAQRSAESGAGLWGLELQSGIIFDIISRATQTAAHLELTCCTKAITHWHRAAGMGGTGL